MLKIVLSGRTDVDEFFKKSGVFESERLVHHPLLAFLEEENAIHVRIIENPRKLLSFPDETPVMGQWPGEWRSNYFQFTVGQYRLYVEEQQELLLSARNVVKRVGPRGGFRLLSYEFVNEQVSLHTPTLYQEQRQMILKHSSLDTTFLSILKLSVDKHFCLPHSGKWGDTSD